jgi:hypothetical protein
VTRRKRCRLALTSLLMAPAPAELPERRVSKPTVRRSLQVSDLDSELARDRAQPCERPMGAGERRQLDVRCHEWERLATNAARDAVAKVLKPVVADLEEQLQQVRAERLNRRSESEPEPSNFLARLLGRA